MKILITGASGGLGLSLTTEALKRGHSVIAACLFDPATEEGIVKLRKEYPEALFPIQMDVSNEEDVKARAQEVLREHPVIDCVINNAGVLLESKYDLEDPIPNLDIAKLRKSIEVNAVGHAIVLKYFIPGIYASSKPCIINITSEAGTWSRNPTPTWLTASPSTRRTCTARRSANYLAQSPEHSNVRPVHAASRPHVHRDGQGERPDPARSVGQGHTRHRRGQDRPQIGYTVYRLPGQPDALLTGPWPALSRGEGAGRFISQSGRFIGNADRLYRLDVARHHEDNYRFEFEQFLKAMRDLGYPYLENFAFIKRYFDGDADAIARCCKNTA